MSKNGIYVTVGGGGYLIVEQILLQLFIDRFISKLPSLSMATFLKNYSR